MDKGIVTEVVFLDLKRLSTWSITTLYCKNYPNIAFANQVLNGLKDMLLTISTKLKSTQSHSSYRPIPCGVHRALYIRSSFICSLYQRPHRIPEWYPYKSICWWYSSILLQPHCNRNNVNITNWVGIEEQGFRTIKSIQNMKKIKFIIFGKKYKLNKIGDINMTMNNELFEGASALNI